MTTVREAFDIFVLEYSPDQWLGSMNTCLYNYKTNPFRPFIMPPCTLTDPFQL
jgi:hypothetical protein